MKWFKHMTDSYANLKLFEIRANFGLEGYATYWLCLELVGQQGKNYCLNGSKGWKSVLKDLTKLDDKKLEEILNHFARLNLISHKSLKQGNLYIPKIGEYADEWTTRHSRLTPEQLRIEVEVDKNRIDKIRKEYIKIKGWSLETFSSDDFARTARAIKTLIIKARGKDDLVVDALIWASQQKWVDWTLETIIRVWPKYMAEVGNIPEHLRKHLKK